MPSFVKYQFGTKTFATAEPLSPGAFGAGHLCPKKVRAGAPSAGCQ
jgi:hypothetical protein